MARNRHGMSGTTLPAASQEIPDTGFLRATLRTPEGVGLLVLLAFTLTALAGYAIFGLRPENLPDSGPIMAFWPISFRFFAQVHILLGAVVLLIALVRYARTRWIAAFAAVYLVSFLSEYLGTGYGIPFGNYEYTALLGSKLGGRVPWVIPLSWFLMAVPAWALAHVTFPDAGLDKGGGTRRTAARVAFAAVILTLWDVALDPAMSYQAPYYWRWSDAGPYYGMPWINLAGWLLTGTVIFAAFEWLKVGRWLNAIPIRWLAGYYAVTLLMPVGMIVLEGLWVAVIATFVAYLAAWGLHLSMARGASPEARAWRKA
jgi:uncharacterized membrane protein